MSKKNKIFIIVGAFIVIGVGTGLILNKLFPLQIAITAGMVRNEILTMSAPAGTTSTELNIDYQKTVAITASSPTEPDTIIGDWPSYNRTLTSDRYTQLSQINTENVGKMKVLCTYDTGLASTFETGLIMVNNALIGTTEFDIFSLDPATCAETWRTHEDYPPAFLSANRGAAYMDGMLFRGTQDGRVLGYDFKTGKRLWATTVADPKMGEGTPSAPIAWNGLVFIGNSGGDFKGGKGRMYALEAKTGKIVWEFYLVPREKGDLMRGPQGKSPLDGTTWKNAPGIPITGGGTWTSYTLDPETEQLYVPGGNPAPDFVIGVREGESLYAGSVIVLDARTGDYKNHFKVVEKDWHDWDVSNAPILIKTAGGKELMTVAPKDGHLYSYDLVTNDLLYRVPVTRIMNEDVPFSTDELVQFCPGVVGGAEWNGASYDPRTNLILIGEVEWCSLAKMQDPEKLRSVPMGQPFNGMATFNPFDEMGQFTKAEGDWAGWVYAVDADTGVWKWRLKSNYPFLSGLTPTAGGVVFVGDIGGNFYALDSNNGTQLWGEKIGGGIGGGVITYTTDGVQKVAVAAGFTHPLWPTEQVNGKIIVLGLVSNSDSVNQ